MKKHDILFRLGSFGKVPYGQIIQGRTWYLKDQNDDSYDACDIDKMKPIDFKPFLKEHEAPVVIVDVGSCRLSRKAQNVEFIGGKLMLLITRNEQLIDELNYDDSFAQVINIPTVIITKSLGDKIKEQLSSGVSYTPTFNFNIVIIRYYLGKI